METRWYLKRDGSHILLVLEETIYPWRGYCCAVTSRKFAREALPSMLALLQSNVGREQPSRTFDPVEVDEHP